MLLLLNLKCFRQIFVSQGVNGRAVNWPSKTVDFSFRFRFPGQPSEMAQTGQLKTKKKKKKKIILSQFWGPEVLKQGGDRVVLPPVALGKIPLLPLPGSGLLGFLGLWPHLSIFMLALFSASLRIPPVSLLWRYMLLHLGPSRSHHCRANRWGNSGNSGRLYFSGIQNHCRWWLQPWN